MATTTPIVENIMVFLESELANISIANGFRTDVSLVSRVLKSWTEIDDNDFPGIFLLQSAATFTPQTNKEVEMIVPIKIIGYVKFQEHIDTSEDIAATKMNNLWADVFEKLYDLHDLAGFDNNTSEPFDITDFETDEGTLEPIAAFALTANIRLAFFHTDTGRKVQ